MLPAGHIAWIFRLDRPRLFVNKSRGAMDYFGIKTIVLIQAIIYLYLKFQENQFTSHDVKE